MSFQQLFAAILADDTRRIKQLLKPDPSLATRTFARPKLERKIPHWIYAGDTMLHVAAAAHRPAAVRLLLAAGADPNAAMNHRDSRPLHYAADGCPGNPVWNEKMQVKTIQCLLEAGAEIDAPDKNGATALHRAVRTRSAAATRFLLEAGSNWKLKNKPGSTPFHLAVQNTGRGGSGTDQATAEQRKIIETFLSLGIPATLKDGKGKSVLDCAKSTWIRGLLVGNIQK